MAALSRLSVPKVFVGVALLASAGCLDATAFDTDPPVSGLTAYNLQRLARSQPATLPFKFVAIGDVHDAYDELAQTVDAINARDDIRFVAVAGDVSDLGLEQEYEWTYEEFVRLDVPYFVVIGNHDALGNGKALYRTMYGPREFRFAHAGFTFLFFNSNSLEFPDSAPNRQWLVSEHAALGEGPAIWVTHQNIAAPDEPAGVDSAPFYRSLLQDNDVRLVVHGHLQGYYRPTALHWTGHIGSEIGWRPAGRGFVQRHALFYQAILLGRLGRAYLDNPDAVKFTDAFASAIGYRMAW